MSRIIRRSAAWFFVAVLLFIAASVGLATGFGLVIFFLK